MNRLNNQNGIVLPMVLAIILIVTILGFAAMSVAENQTIMVSRHQQREQALHYAEAGINCYMSELNKSPYSNYSAPANATAFEDGYYQLTITAPDVENPYVRVTSTGWHKNSENIKRTVEVKLHKKQFVQNLMTSNVGNDLIWYTRRFMRGDIINGPLHVNGDLVVDGFHGDGQIGPVFTGPVTYSGNFRSISAVGELLNIIDVLNWIPDLNNTTDFQAGTPVKVDRMGMPASNQLLAEKADADYVFTGRTCIHLRDDKLKIVNKGTTYDNLPLPPNKIIYVKGGIGNNKWDYNTANVYVSGTLNGQLSIVAENDIYITATDPTVWNKPSDTPPANGGIYYHDLESIDEITNQDYLDSQLAKCDDMLGLIANRNVRILHYNWPRGSSPFYYKKSSLTHYDVAPKNMNVFASIYAVTGSFEYEAHDQGGKKGNLTVVGSITQYKVGPTAGFGPNLLDSERWDLLHERKSGYGRNYWHDTRLMYEMPPHFLEPTNNGWEIVEWQEVSNPVVAEP